MFNRHKDKSLERSQGSRAGIILALAIGLVMVGVSQSASAQDPQNQAPAAQSQSAPPPAQDNGKPKQDIPDDAGGPTDSVGPYAIPKKKVDDAPPPPPPPAPKKLEDVPDYSLKVNVPLVNVDVLVTTKDGQFIPGLKQGNFRILEDGVQQQV